MPIILNEDKAIKAMLQGIRVSDSANAQRPVGVWFGQPDMEIRDQVYPYITIDFIGYSEDFERAHRGMISMPYYPEGVDPGTVGQNGKGSKQYTTEVPIPVNLDYQITTYARQPRHDRALMAEMLTGQRIPLRFGEIVVPEDKTVRRMDLLGFSKKDTTDQNGKRLFSNVYNIRISAEVLPQVISQKYPVQTPPIISLNSQSTPFETIQI
jgi:hypothetical protein